MEEEAREILRHSLTGKQKKVKNLAEAIRQRFATVGGVELPELPREPIRKPPSFR